MNPLVRAKSLVWLAPLVVGLSFWAGIGQNAQPRPSSRPKRVDEVCSFQFSPDGRTLAIARGGSVELWDVDTGNLRHAIKGFDGAVWSLSFAPDSKTLITGSSGYHSNKIQVLSARDQTRVAELKWWDVQTGDLKQQMDIPGDDRLGVKAYYSPNGNLLATVEYTSVVTTFGYGGFGGFNPDRRESFPNPVVNSLGFNTDLKLRDARTGEVRLKLKSGLISYEKPAFGGNDRTDYWLSSFQSSQRRQPLAFSPNGELIAGWTSSELRFWNSLTGAELRKLKDFKGTLSAAAFSPDGRSLALGITRFSIKNRRPIFKSAVQVYDVTAGSLKQTLALTTHSISSVVFALNGRQLLISGSQTNGDHTFATVELLDLQTGSMGTIQARNEGTMSSAVLSPNGALLAFQTDASTVKLVDTQTWRSRYTFDDTGDLTSNRTSFNVHLVTVKSAMALAFSAGGKIVWGEIEQGGIKSWDTRTGELKKHFGEQEDTGSIVAISANPIFMADVGSDETLRFWNIATGEKTALSASGKEVSALALSSTGEILAVGSPTRVTLINTATRKTVRTIERSRVSCLSLSDDGQLLASGAEDGAIEIWSVGTGDRMRTIRSSGKVTALRFSNDLTLASASVDKSVSLWDSRNGTLILQLKKHSAAVNAIAFSADGSLMATGGDDRSVIIWETATGKARRTLKGHDLAVTSLAFSLDGSLLASGAGNASVVLWDVATGKLNRVLK